MFSKWKNGGKTQAIKKKKSLKSSPLKKKKTKVKI